MPKADIVPTYLVSISKDEQLHIELNIFLKYGKTLYVISSSGCRLLINLFSRYVMAILPRAIVSDPARNSMHQVRHFLGFTDRNRRFQGT